MTNACNINTHKHNAIQQTCTPLITCTVHVHAMTHDFIKGETNSKSSSSSTA